jgi:hypothetical protein
LSDKKGTGPGQVSESELADRICSFDDAIMFCVIISSQGDIHVIRSRPGSESLVRSKSDVEMLAKRWAIVRGIDDTADKLLGPSRSAIVLRDKITLMSINAPGGRCAFVGASPNVDIRKVREMEEAVALLSP